MCRFAARVGALALFLLSSTALFAQDLWVPLDAGTTADLAAVSFPSDGVGYAVGSGGTVVKTTDGGANWADVSVPDGSDLYGVHFFDANIGVVVGDGGTILRTEDGGATWSPVSSGVAETLYAVSFSGSVGLAGGSAQTILRSEDQGATWAVVQTDFFGGGFFGADMLDADRGFVAGQNSIFQPLFAYTDDGGQTFGFTAFYLDSNEGQLEAVAFLDAQTGVTVGQTWDFQGAASTTQDGGQTWTTTLSAEVLKGVDFAFATTGYAVGAAGTLLKTGDAGETWEPVPSGRSETLHDIDFPTPDIGYVVGSGGTVLRGAIKTGTSITDGVPSPPVVLEQNRPNPARAETAIRYTLAAPTPVALRVFDALGREVAVVARGVQGTGRHEIVLDTARLGPGVYVYRLEAGAATRARRMLVVR